MIADQNQVPPGIEVPEGHYFHALWVSKTTGKRFDRTDSEDQPFDLNCKLDPDYVKSYDFYRIDNYKAQTSKYVQTDTTRNPVSIDDSLEPTPQHVGTVGMNAAQVVAQQQTDANVLHRATDAGLVAAQPAAVMPDELPAGEGPMDESRPARTVPASKGGLLAEQMANAAD